MTPKPQTHEERERKFTALFQTVPADREGTGMGNTDKARDEAFAGLTFDKLPENPPEYEISEPPVPKAEHASLMEDPSELRKETPAAPLQLDEKHKKFYALFGHVTDAQAAEYGGQAFAPDKDVDFDALPERHEDPELPDVSKQPERDFLREDAEERLRYAHPEEKHSEKYDKAHEGFVKIFKNPVEAE
ncbi:unnamed protein product [Ostreobium quekettii]|uniref:Uncharacterized protein n=1 Tax=Ostreobium quekettii TaxID=121088 RepID=A0A8S1ITK6_9CHLO|nr:unnamed protein product [Ostreobium quekettii]|eukprot:evm.model.scf_1514EXC.2 EVM.evm.TU.scf_1514EXC.2   scf_1514EXC:7803-8944(+)